MSLVTGDGALFSRDRRYRYHLWRTWDQSIPQRAVFIGLNPSRADENDNDPTIRRCLGFASAWKGKWRCGGMSVVNLYAYCSPNPQDLKTVINPQGRNNLRWLKKVCDQTPPPVLIAMWGNHGEHADMATRVLKKLALDSGALHCLRINQSGAPAHPLYLPGGLKPIPFGGW